MGSIGIGDTLFPTHGSYPRSRSIECFLRLLQSSLIIIYIKLDVNCPYEPFIHKRSVAESRTEIKERTPIGAIFSSLSEDRGFRKWGFLMNLRIP
jgi:hypothetical protein